MRNLSSNQIDQVKAIKACNSTQFHGNKRKVDFLNVSDIINIIEKKRRREISKMVISKKSYIQLTKECIQWSLECKGTNYFKVMIEGNTSIYYTHPGYMHSDYNKSRLFPKNEETLKLMSLFNSIVNK